MNHVNCVRATLEQGKCLKPMKKVFLEEHLNICAAAYDYVALYTVVHPEPTCVLDMWLNMFVHFDLAQVGYLDPWVLEIAHVAPQVL